MPFAETSTAPAKATGLLSIRTTDSRSPRGLSRTTTDRRR